MARRKKTSPAEDVMDLVALLPWWAGAGLALAFYAGLHAVASQPVVTAMHPSQMGAMFTQTLWKTLASVGQYLLPTLCLAGAGMSAWRRKKREGLVSGVTKSDADDVLNGMTWQEFEMLVGQGFRRQGYHVLESGGGGADGGVDLVLSRPGKSGSEKFLVQCKQWRAFRVGVEVVRELYGVMAATGAAGGFVVTSGRFTKEAVDFAGGRNVALVDGTQLQRLLRQTTADKPVPHPRAAQPTPKPAAQPPGATPTCPVCSKGMVRRTAKRGANAGADFWGCAAYPACRGTRAVD